MRTTLSTDDDVAARIEQLRHALDKPLKELVNEALRRGLVDANILVYAFTTSFSQHERARAWLDERLSEPVPVGLP